VKRRVKRRFLVIVEHDSAWRLQNAEELFGIMSGKGGNIPQILGGKNGERFATAGSGLFRRKPQVIEKGGDVPIPFIYLVPESGKTPLCEPTGDKGGFTGAGGSGYPD
jgi:hypothetical protein